MARRVKMDLEMREPEFDVDFWAVREDSEKDGTPVTESNEVETSELKKAGNKIEKLEEEKLGNDNSFALLEEDS